MSESELLKERVRQLEQQLKELPQKILRDVTKMIQMHTHEMGGHVIWKLPPGGIKSLLEEEESSTTMSAAELMGTEKVTLKDSVIITKQPAQVD